MRELQALEQGSLENSERIRNQLIEQIELLEQQIRLNQTLNEIGETVVGKGADELRQEQLKLNLRRENLLAQRDAEEISERKFKNELKTLAAEQKSLRAKKQGYQDSENFAKRFFGITRQPTSEFGKFLVDPAARLEGLTKGLSEVIDPMSVLTSTVDKVVESTLALAVEQDRAIVTFNKATGASGEFDDNIRGLERSLFTAGVSSQEAAASVQSLFQNVSDFTMMSKIQQETLGKTVAVLNELGVSSEITAKNIQFTTKVLGQSTEEAAALQRELFVFAQDLGVSASQIAGDFQTLAPQIAAMGKNGVDAFKNLEAQSKSTGLAMNELLQIVQKFDRFDTAAESVSRLNALLGGPFLNATELVAETDLSKRFEILKNRLDDAGLSFDQMDYYQRKATASAMGLNEQQLALLMRGRTDLIQAPQKSAAELEALADQTAQFNTVMDELAEIGRTLAISIGPIISGFKTFLQAITPLYPLLEGLAYAIIPVLVLTLYSMIPPMGGILGLTMGITAALAATGLVIIGVVLYGLYQLLELIMPGSGPIVLGLAGLTVAFYALGAAIGVATGGILPLLGLFVTMATYLFTKIASPGLIEILGLAAAAVMLLPPAMLALAGSLIIILPFLPILGIALYGLSKMLPDLAVGFAALGTVVTSVLSDQFVTNLQLMAVEIANIVDKINELDMTKAFAVTATTAVVAAGGAISGIAAGAMDAIGINVGGGGATPATAPAVASGPPAEIKLNITIDGESIAGAINNVEVSNYVKGQRSKLYDSIIDAVVGTQLVSS